LIISERGATEDTIEVLEQLVKKGNTEAMWKLGLRKEFGMGTEQNLREAKLLYQESCDGGSPIGTVLAMIDNEDDFDDEYDDRFDDYVEEMDDLLDEILLNNIKKVSFRYN